MQDYTPPAPTSTPGQPKVALAMIVKNEAHGIAATLRAAAALGVDQWLILDTGSTDDTTAIVRSEAEACGADYYLFEEPFVDFATTRNRVLELCNGVQGLDWILCLDADDTPVVPVTPLAAQLAALPAGVNAARVQLRMEALTFEPVRLLRARAGWQYVGVVHEVPQGPGEIGRVALRVDHFPPAASQAATRARWTRDVELLKAELAKDPTHTRTSFYLGLTYSWLGDWTRAITALQHRVRLGGWAEEVYYAQLQIARCMQGGVFNASEISKQFLLAWASRPRRAEALYELAHWHISREELAQCYLYASAADALPKPDDILFVDADVHRWQAADLVASTAFYLGEPFHAIGAAAAQKAAAACPGDARIQNNLTHYR